MAWRRRLGLLLACGLLLVACGDDGTDGDGDDGASDDAAADDGDTDDGDDSDDGDTADSDEGDTDDAAAGPCPEGQGGTLRMGMVSQSGGLDPIVVPGSGVTGGNELHAVYDTLMKFNADEGAYEPHMAEALEPNESFDEWTLTLREGVTFANGDPLDADAVIASLERYQGEDNTGPYRTLALYIEEMTASDELTVEMSLNRPWASFPFLLGNSGGMIVNTAVVEEQGEDFATNAAGAGAGPFVPTSFAPGEELIMEAREGYWNEGRPCLESVVYVPIPEGQTRYDAFRNDELDATFLREPLTISLADEDGHSSISEVSGAGNAVLLNAGIGESDRATEDPRVRRAFALAIDVEAIDERVNEGAGIPSKTLLPTDSVFGGQLEALPHDPDAASELLEEAMADLDWDGSLELTADQGREEMALTMEGQLESVGFDITLAMVNDLTELVDKSLVRQDYDVTLWGHNVIESAPWAILSNQFYSDSSGNYGGYVDPNMDTALDELSTAQTADELTAALAEVQAVWNETVPSVPIEATQVAAFFHEHVNGLKFNNNSILMLDEVYLSE